MRYKIYFPVILLFCSVVFLMPQGTEKKIAEAAKKMGEATTAGGKKLAIGKFSLTTPDINVFMKGRIREEYFNLHSITTLRKDFFDELDMFRHKFSFYFYAIQGLQKYGKAATEAYMKLTNYSFWQNEGYYVHNTEEKIYMHRDDPTEQVVLMDDHTHKLWVPALFMEDVWVKINFGTFNDFLEKHPLSLKIGLFEYQLGRGISLGQYLDLGIEFMGWKGPAGAHHFPHCPPGISLRGKIVEHLFFDFYYSKWHETNNYPTDVRQPYHAQLLKDNRVERGSTKDQDSWSLKFDFDYDSKKYGNWHVEPYGLYVRAPEQSIEVEADASSKLGTFGCMVEWKKGGFKVNVEGAFQVGHQHVFALDRNHIEIERDPITGLEREVYSHVYLNDSWNGYFKAPVTSATDSLNLTTKGLKQYVNNETNRNIDRNGQPIVKENGDPIDIPYSFDMTTPIPQQSHNYIPLTAYNSNLLGNERFRYPFKIDFEGYMGLADVSYFFDKWRFKPAAMVGYISGDDYPYNYPYKDRKYKGFLTLRDKDYYGVEVQSYAVLESRILPRPLNISYYKAYAYNHVSDSSNLIMLGGGLTWHPFKRLDKMILNFNVISFWSATRVYKWDKNATVSFDNLTPNPKDEATFELKKGYSAAVWQQALPTIHVEGWQSNERASRHLGIELNAQLKMYFLGSCEWRLRGLIFIPGDLYKDLDGQPNHFTRYATITGEKYYKSLGSTTVWGVHTSLTYRF